MIVGVSFIGVLLAVAPTVASGRFRYCAFIRASFNLASVSVSEWAENGLSWISGSG
jgi:hypothetical protein